MDVDEFWVFLEGSARETVNPEERLRWLGDRLSRVSLARVVDFQAHLDAARRPVDTYAMWGAAYQIMDRLCSGDGFWYFQPWLIGQGREWYEHAVRDPDNLADLPGVRALAGRWPCQWSDAEWPDWEGLAYVARRAHDRRTGQKDSRSRSTSRTKQPAAAEVPASDWRSFSRRHWIWSGRSHDGAFGSRNLILILRRSRCALHPGGGTGLAGAGSRGAS
jgi:hypothetical protein